MTSITLRAEITGHDRRYLSATVDGDGNLVLSGQDLGPGTSMVSPDGEYEYWITVEAAYIPLLLARLGAPERSDILEVLALAWTGERSYGLERIIRDDGVPHRLSTYS